MNYLKEEKKSTWNFKNKEERTNSLMVNPFTEWFEREKERKK